MKTITLMMVMVLAPLTVFAQAGSHGGDVCEQRFKNIARDIRQLILGGGANQFQFQSGHSAKEYKAKMLSWIEPLLNQDANAIVLECVGKDVKVEVNNVPKTCVWFDSAEDAKKHIRCSFERFNGTSQVDQYRLTHHEFASIIGYEDNNGSNSDYFYSDQITTLGSWVQVFQLSIPQKKDYDYLLPIEFKKADNLDGSVSLQDIRIIRGDVRYPVWAIQGSYNGLCKILGYELVDAAGLNYRTSDDEFTYMIRFDADGGYFEPEYREGRLITKVTCSGMGWPMIDLGNGSYRALVPMYNVDPPKRRTNVYFPG